MEERLHGGVHVARETGPHRDRKQHDVGSRKARNREAPQQVRALGAAAVVADLRRLGRMKAGVLQHGGKRLCVGALGIEPHGDAFGRQIGTRARDARRGEQRLFHGGHTASAAHVGDDEGHVTGLARGWGDDGALATAERDYARFHGLIHSRSLAS